MSIVMTQIGNNSNMELCKFIADYLSDINDLPTTSTGGKGLYENFPPVKMGSSCFILENRTLYYLGSNGKWVIGNVLDVKGNILSLNLKTTPAKDIYEKGEKLDLYGLTLDAKYESGIDITINDGFTVEGYDPYTAGSQELNVYYHGAKTTFHVYVKDFKDKYQFRSISPMVKYQDYIGIEDEFTIEIIGSSRPGYLIHGALYQIEIKEDGTVAAWNFYNPQKALVSTDSYSGEEFTHVVLVGNKDTFTMYINGQYVDCDENADYIKTENEDSDSEVVDLNFGGCIMFGRQSEKILARIYNRVATEENIRNLYDDVLEFIENFEEDA